MIVDGISCVLLLLVGWSLGLRMTKIVRVLLCQGWECMGDMWRERGCCVKVYVFRERVSRGKEKRESISRDMTG